MAVRKINLNMDEQLLERIDAYAKYMGVSRTAAISFLCGNQLYQADAIKALSGAVEVLEKEEKE